MKVITLSEANSMKAEEIRRCNNERAYTGNSTAEQRIQFIENMSDEEYMKTYNEVASKENAKAAAAKEKKSAVCAERKATGKSKKAYRAEYDALMAEYKKTGSTEAKNSAKAIAKFAF